MRAIELLEYRRDITAQQLGSKVASVWKHEAKSWQDRAIMFLMSRYDWTGTELPDSILDNKKSTPEQIAAFIIKGLELSDPTQHKEYTEWLVRRYGEGKWHLEDVLSKIPTELKKFNELKIRKMLPPEARDINRYKDFNSFQNYVEGIWNAAGLEQKSQVGKGTAKEYYNDNEIRVIVPEDEEAACYYGQGSKWCTSGRENNMFDNYNKRGPLYIIIPKHPDYVGEKYQFHFADEQFMNERDEPVSLQLLVERYPSLTRAFAQQAKQYHIFSLMSEREQGVAYEGAERYLLNVGKVEDGDILTVNLSSDDSDNGISWYRCKMVEAFTGQLLHQADFGSEGAIGVAVIDLRDKVLPAIVYTIGEATETTVITARDFDGEDVDFASEDQESMAAQVKISMAELLNASDDDHYEFIKQLQFFYNRYGAPDNEPVNT